MPSHSDRKSPLNLTRALALIFISCAGIGLFATRPQTGERVKRSDAAAARVAVDADASEAPAALVAHRDTGGGARQVSRSHAVPQTPADVAEPGGALPGSPAVQLIRVADGLEDPISVSNAGDGTGRIFIVERPGRIRILQNGKLLEQPFLDISDRVLSAFLEQGLYSVAFHPDYERNGYFYVHFAEKLRNGDSMIVRYHVSADDPNQAEPDSAMPVLHIEQPFANHNGGRIAFGPDGYLYIGMGDGGWEGDPLEAGQRLNTLHGKLLRIDVNTGDERPYRIPATNPFLQKLQLVQIFGLSEDYLASLHPEARPEIVDWGLRNPYEFSFDRQNGDLYIADVGQEVWEEIDYRPLAAVGANWGWDLLEGAHCFPVTAERCAQAGTLPVAQYSHDFGCAIIGMGVYRGNEFPSLQGIYYNSDFCSGRIWGLLPPEGSGTDTRWRYAELLNTTLKATGSGEGEDGTLYLTSCDCSYKHPEGQGAVWRLVAADQVPRGATTAPIQQGVEPQEEHEE